MIDPHMQPAATEGEEDHGGRGSGMIQLPWADLSATPATLSDPLFLEPLVAHMPHTLFARAIDPKWVSVSAAGRPGPHGETLTAARCGHSSTVSDMSSTRFRNVAPMAPQRYPGHTHALRITPGPRGKSQQPRDRQQHPQHPVNLQAPHPVCHVTLSRTAIPLCVSPQSSHDPRGYYTRLEVSHTASTSDIQAAFRAAALTHHPDRCGPRPSSNLRSGMLHRPRTFRKIIFRGLLRTSFRCSRVHCISQALCAVRAPKWPW